MKLSVKVSAMATLLFTGATSAVEDPVYYFYGLSLSNVESLASPANGEFSAEIVPGITLGVGTEYRLNPEWVIESELSLDYSNTKFRFNAEPATAYDNLSNLGIWATSKLKREHLFANVSPFIELGVGKVNVHYDQQNESVNDWTTGTKALIGVEFDVTDLVTVSFAVGKNDYADGFR